MFGSNKSLSVLFTLALLVALAVSLTPAAAQEGDPIVVTWWSEPSNLDIHSFGTDGDGDIRSGVYSPLVRRAVVPGPYENTTIAAPGEYVGALAESWEISDDNMSITFHLREGAMFASGNPVTAEDVRFTIERGMLSPTSYMGGLMPLGGIDDPAQVEVVDDQSVRINTTHGVTPLLFELLAIVNSSIVDKVALLEHATEDDPYATAWLPLNAAGGGPYVLTRAEPGVEFAMAPNPNYFDPESVRNDGIVFKVIPTASDRLLLLRTGELDVLRGVPFSEVDALKAEEGIEVLDYPSTDMRAIALNNNVPPFDDPAVRRAVAYAIPYQDILDTVWLGYATQLKSPTPEGMPTSDFSFWEYETNLETARQLLTDAGYENGFETTLFTRADNQDDQQVAVLVQDALREIGVTVNIEALTSGPYAARQFNDRDMPMFFFDFISYVNDPYYHYHWLLTCGQGVNYANYCDPAVDELIQQGLATSDPDERAAISRQIQQLHVEASPWIYLSQPNSITAIRDDIQGWEESPDRLAHYWTLSRAE